MRCVSSPRLGSLHSIFGATSGFTVDQYSGFLSSGYLAVDLFFMLSGFVMAHSYIRRLSTGEVTAGQFLMARFTRIYPLHVFMLALFCAAGLAATALRIDSHREFPVQDLPATLLLIHAWGVLDHLSWNDPSWSISAEWFAYLVVAGGFVWIVRMSDNPVRWLAAAVAAFVVLFGLLEVLRWQPLTSRTYDVSILQIVPEFGIGIALYFAGERLNVSGRIAGLSVVAALIGVALTSHFRLSALIVVLCEGLLIAAIAQLAKSADHNPLRARGLIWLGERSYSLYMVHFFVFLVGFKLLSIAGIAQVGSVGWSAVPVLLCVLIAATFTFRYVETPAREWGRQIAFRRLAPIA